MVDELILEDKSFSYWEELAGLVLLESRRQFLAWGVQKHSIAWWLAILGEEIGEINKAAIEHNFNGGNLKDIEDEAIQSATICLKIAEMARAKRLEEVHE